MNTKLAILSSVLALSFSAELAAAAPGVQPLQAVSPQQQLAAQPPPLNAHMIGTTDPYGAGPYSQADTYVTQEGFPLGGWSQLTRPFE